MINKKEIILQFIAKSKKINFERISTQKWYHGTIHEFNKFDKNELGKSSNSKDAKLGFYFGKNIQTAESYLETTQDFNKENFFDKFKMTIEEAEEKIKLLDIRFEEKYGVKYSIIKTDLVSQFELKRSNPEFRADFDKMKRNTQILNPFHYDEHDSLIDNKLLGKVLVVEICDKNINCNDMEHTPWNEEKQMVIAKQAIEDCYDGVLFSNMQDSGWFGGNGVDDISLVFNDKNILITGEYDYTKSDVTFKEIIPNKFKATLINEELSNQYPEFKINDYLLLNNNNEIKVITQNQLINYQIQEKQVLKNKIK
jgi:hypothetical protein